MAKKPTSRPGKVSLTFQQGHAGPRVHLRVTDDLSRAVMIDVDVEYGLFAAMFNGQTECDYTLGAQGLAGMEKQHKEEQVFVPHLYMFRGDEAAQLIARALAPYEKDGWVATVADLTNPHCTLGVKGINAVQLALKAGLDEYVEAEPFRGQVQLVGFHRYVDPASGVVVERPKPQRG